MNEKRDETNQTAEKKGTYNSRDIIYRLYDLFHMDEFFGVLKSNIVLLVRLIYCTERHKITLRYEICLIIGGVHCTLLALNVPTPKPANAGLIKIDLNPMVFKAIERSEQQQETETHHQNTHTQQIITRRKKKTKPPQEQQRPNHLFTTTANKFMN